MAHETITDVTVQPKPRYAVMGRPPKYTALEKQEIAQDLQKYIDTTEDPTIAKFISTYKDHPVNQEYVSANFSELVKFAIKKQEAFLIGQFDKPTMAIFRLKQPQHGYTDKQELHTTNMNVNVNVEASEAIGNDFAAYLKERHGQN